MKKITLAIGLIASSLFIAACTKQAETPATEPAAQTEQNGGSTTVESSQQMEVTDGTLEATQDGVTKVALQAKNFSFGTSEVKVKKGTKLVLAVTNEQGVHDIVIDELKISSGVIPEGEMMEIEVPTDTVGTFEYYCSIGEHRKMGMKGMLTIEE